MDHIFTKINTVQTGLITLGNPNNCNGRDVIVCITGNPGNIDFYTEFASEVHRATELPICVVGHAGHVTISGQDSDDLKGKEHLYNLKGQLEHKLDLLNNFIDQNSKLHLVGHSIGAWLILEALHQNDELIKRVKSINLLFPTIQKMAESKKGSFLNNFTRKIHVIIILLLTLLDLLPFTIRSFIISMYLKSQSLPSYYAERILNISNSKSLEKVLFMAYDEMDNVKTLNRQCLDKVKHLCNVIYGSKDDWAPVHYMDDLKTFQPQLKMRQVDIDHSFVLKYSEPIAELVAEFIKTKI